MPFHYITKYQVVQAHSPDALARKINEALKRFDAHEMQAALVGGICVSNEPYRGEEEFEDHPNERVYKNRLTYSQAFLKTERYELSDVELEAVKALFAKED